MKNLKKMNVNEKAEQYAREHWGDNNDIECQIAGCEMSIGEISAQDFIAGYDFAMAQPKHIFDGVAVAGEVRRFDGELVDVIERRTCYGCALFTFNNCMNLTGCDHNVKYIKRV